MTPDDFEPKNEGNNGEPTTEDELKPSLSPDDILFDMGEDYDFDDFEVVRREFFAHLSEPAIVFNDCKFYVNSACLKKFPNVRFAQVLINRKKKVLALLPCSEYTKDSFPWCNESKGKRQPKHITCKIFFAKIMALMGWTPDCKYKIIGKVVHANGMYLLAFDLTARQAYPKTYVEGKKPRTSRTPVYPEGWQNQFGLPYSEHQKSMQINIFDGYAVYAIKDNKVVDKNDANRDPDVKEVDPK